MSAAAQTTLPLALTLLIVVFNRRPIRGHLLDLSPGLLGGLYRPQLVLLLVDPVGGEASVVLRQTGGSRGGYGCRQETAVRPNTLKGKHPAVTVTPRSPSAASC